MQFSFGGLSRSSHYIDTYHLVNKCQRRLVLYCYGKEHMIMTLPATVIAGLRA